MENRNQFFLLIFNRCFVEILDIRQTSVNHLFANRGTTHTFYIFQRWTGDYLNEYTLIHPLHFTSLRVISVHSMNDN